MKKKLMLLLDGGIFMKRKLILLLAYLFCILMSTFTISGFAITSKTSGEALSWVSSNEGKSIGSGECVALIAAYYNYLGFNSVSGNGCDYATNNIPNGLGWREKGGVPQPGDILIYTGSTYGHVAIHESDNVSWHQNWGGRYVKRVSRNYRNSYTYQGQTNTYWGCIHVDFSNTTTTTKIPQTPTIKNVSVSGSNVSVSWNNVDQAEKYVVDYWNANTNVHNYFSTTNTSMTQSLSDGLYGIRVCAENSLGQSVFSYFYYIEVLNIEVTTGDFSIIDDSTMRVSGTYYNPNYITVKQSGFYYGTDVDNMVCGAVAKNESYLNGGMYYDLKKLIPGETYYYQAFVSNGIVEKRGPVKCFSVVTQINNLDAVKYNNHAYIMIEESSSWTDAKKTCEEMGGHLATITSENEFNVIKSLIKAKELCVWIGATDEKNEGEWKWVTDEEFTFENWGNSQPDNYGNAEHYLSQLNADYNYVWYDVSNNGNRAFICEFDSLPSVPITTVKKTDNILTTETVLYHTKPCTIFIAGYKNGKLLTLKSQLYNLDKVTFTLEGNIDEIIVMVWDSLQTMNPLCDAEIITKEQFVTE